MWLHIESAIYNITENINIRKETWRAIYTTLLHVCTYLTDKPKYLIYCIGYDF